VQPWGYLRVPDSLVAPAGVPLPPLEVRVRSRMGELTRGLGLPLVAVADGVAVPLTEDSTGAYRAAMPAAAVQGRIIVASLTGNFPRRVVAYRQAAPVAAPWEQATRTPPPGAVDFAVARKTDGAIAIDGSLDDWQRIPRLHLDAATAAVLTPERPRDPADLSARVGFAWDDSTLYLSAGVDDDALTTGDGWESDRVNVVLDLNGDDTPVTYASRNLQLGDWQDDDLWLYIRPFPSDSAPPQVMRAGRTGHARVRGARAAARRRAGGYDVEVAIPKGELPQLGLFVGAVSGLQVFITDVDGGPPTELMWHGHWPYGDDGLEWHLGDLGRLIFVDAARPVPR
jgi:hypothetical protein